MLADDERRCCLGRRRSVADHLHPRVRVLGEVTSSLRRVDTLPTVPVGLDLSLARLGSPAAVEAFGAVLPLGCGIGPRNTALRLQVGIGCDGGPGGGSVV